jgi:dienelactone hydrolase
MTWQPSTTCRGFLLAAAACLDLAWQSGSAAAQSTSLATFTSRSADAVMLSATLYRPAGAGPFPAIVAMHGCGGNWQRDGTPIPRVTDWTSRWNAAGYAVLWPDSFKSRGLGPQCNVADRAINPAIRASDAEAAVAWLVQAPNIDRSKIALIGWSNGGGTVLRAVSKARPWTGDDVRLAVAFYPGCRPLIEARTPWQPRRPTTILMGAADDWTPPEPCRQLAAAHPDVVRYIEYPGAFHNFDAPDSPLRQRRNLAFTADKSGVAHTGTDPGARKAAIAHIEALLATAFR